MSKDNRNPVSEQQTYEEFVAAVRAAKDYSHKKGKKVLINYFNNVLKYNLNPTKLNYAIRYLEENAPKSDVLKEFKDKVNTEEFKTERAEYILRAGFIDLEDAVNYIKEKDENSPLLKEFNVGDMEAFKEERARDMAENKGKYRVNGRFDPHIHAADDYLDSLPHRVVEKPVERVVESAEETVKNEEKKHAPKGVFTMKFDNIKNCSIAQAMQVVQYAFKYDNETIEDAFAKIRTLAPMEADINKKNEMEKLIKLAGLDFEELRKKQAKELKESLENGATVDAELLDRADSYLASVDTYEGPDDIKDSATAEKNYDALKAELDALEEVDANGNPKWMAIVKEYTDKFAFTDKDGKEAGEAGRKKAIETLWRTTKTNILVSHTLDWEWMKKFNAKDTDKAILVRDEVEDFYGFSLAKAYDAKSIRSPKGKELDVGSDEYLNYMKEVTDKSAKSLKRLLSDSKSKLKVGIDTIVAAAAHAYGEIDSMAQHLDAKGFKSKFVNKVKKYRNEFDDWMEANHHKSWKRAKTIAANFKANKVQIISNTVATIAYTGATVASIATVNPALWAGASKVYAGYIAGGSAIFPFFNKRHIEREQARQRGEDVAKWTGFKGLRNAVKSTFSSGRETLSWSAKVGFGMAAAYVTCAIADSTVANMCVQKSVERAAEFVLASRGARLMSSLVRSGASVAAQVTTWATDGIKYAFKPNEINKAYYEQSKQGLKWGAIIAGCGAAFQILSYEILGARGSSTNNHVEENAVQHDEEPAKKVATKVVKKAVKTGADVREAKGSNSVLPPEGATVTEVAYPPVWKESCGLSKEHFAEMYGYTDKKGNWHEGKITGILARQNKAFDEWNKAHPDDLRQIQVKKPDAMYKELMENLHKARAADKTGTLFAGKTDDQVIYQYIKNVEYSEKVKDGPVVNGVETLITRVGKDKLPLYASNQAEMQALFKILRCGEKANVSIESLNATLDRIDMKTGAGIGKEFEVVKTNNSFWGFGPDCGDGVSMWRKGWNKVKNVFVKTTQMRPLEPVEPEIKSVQPVDADVRTVQMRELEPVDAEVKSTNMEEGIILGRTTTDLHDNDTTDKVAHEIKKVGATVFIKNENGGR